MPGTCVPIAVHGPDTAAGILELNAPSVGLPFTAGNPPPC